MALMVPTLQKGLQVVDSGRGHQKKHGGANEGDGVHNLPISRAIRERSRNA